MASEREREGEESWRRRRRSVRSSSCCCCCRCRLPPNELLRTSVRIQSQSVGSGQLPSDVLLTLTEWWRERERERERARFLLVQSSERHSLTCGDSSWLRVECATIESSSRRRRRHWRRLKRFFHFNKCERLGKKELRFRAATLEREREIFILFTSPSLPPLLPFCRRCLPVGEIIFFCAIRARPERLQYT